MAQAAPRETSIGSSPGPADTFDLTSAQVGIWVDQALHANKPIYNTGQILTIRSALDPGRFTAAVRAATGEIDALRVRFVRQGSDVVGEIVDHLDPFVPMRDFSLDPAAEPAASAWMEEIFWQPLAPSGFPLFQFALAKVAADKYFWLQKYHHLIIDAGGRQTVASRIATIYDSLATDAPPPPFPGGSCRLAKEEEDEYRRSEQFADDERYWRARFSELPDLIVRTDVALSERSRSGRPRRIECDVTSAESAALAAFARSRGSSVFKVVLGLIWSCFHRLYGCSDVVLGVPVANRTSARAKSTVGLFSKVIPFRTHCEDIATFELILSNINACLSEDLRHQKFPTNRINEILQIRKRRRAGLYDAMVNYVRNDYEFEMGGAPVSCANLSAGFSVPWGIMIYEYGRKSPIGIAIDYDAGRVSSEQAETFARCLRGFLANIAQGSGLDVAGPTLLIEGPAQPTKTAVEPPIGAAAHVDAARSSDYFERAMLELWRECFDGRSMGLEEDFFELGGDSVKAMRLIAACNDRFSVALPLTLLFEHPTIAGLAAAVRSASQGGSPSRAIRLRKGGDGPPLLLVHPAGGTLFCYRELVARLPADWSIFGFEASGLKPGEELPGSIEEMASDYLRISRRSAGSGPYHLCGWSFGGLVAFEMARQLAAEGRRAATLTLIDTPARLLGRSDEDEAIALAAIAGAFGLDPATLAGPGVELSIEAIMSAAAERQIAVSAESTARMLAVVSNVRRLRRCYQPARIAGGMTLIRALLEPNNGGARFDWDAFVDGQVRLIRISATHDSIMLAPQVDRVAKILAECHAAARDYAENA